MKLPKARTADILEQEAGSELLIYDLQIDKAYSLNETSKIVYRACADQMSFDKLKRASDFTDDLIHFALAELRSNNLIEDDERNHFAGMNRREVVKRVALSTMIALPVITGLLAPRAANAASGGLRANNQSCTSDTQCASGACVIDSNFNQRCCAQLTQFNFPFPPGGSFQSGSQNTCDSQAARFCCSGMGMFNSANSGTCTCR